MHLVDVIDGAQQCSVSQVISGGIDGIHKTQALLLRGVRVLSFLCSLVIKVFPEGGVYLLHTVHHIY